MLAVRGSDTRKGGDRKLERSDELPAPPRADTALHERADSFQDGEETVDGGKRDPEILTDWAIRHKPAETVSGLTAACQGVYRAVGPSLTTRNKYFYCRAFHPMKRKCIRAAFLIKCFIHPSAV